jgi:hypothetical protein
MASSHPGPADSSQSMSQKHSQLELCGYPQKLAHVGNAGQVFGSTHKRAVMRVSLGGVGADAGAVDNSAPEHVDHHRSKRGNRKV